MAKRIGVTQGQVSHLERGVRDWTAAIMHAYAAVVGAEAADLMDAAETEPETEAQRELIRVVKAKDKFGAMKALVRALED